MKGYKTGKRIINANYFNNSTDTSRKTSAPPSPTNSVYYVSGNIDNSPEYSPGKSIKIPTEPIVVRYACNYDIRYIDAVIKEKLSNNNKTIRILEKELKSIDKEIELSFSVPVINSLKTRRVKVEQRIKELKENILLERYLKETQQYIRAYSNIPKKEIVIDIMDVDQSRLTKNDMQVERIVDEFLVKAGTYIQLEIHKEIVEHSIYFCLSCKNDLSNIKTTRMGTKVCKSCGMENKIPQNIPIAPKEYDIFGNFMKAHNRYVGKVTLKFNMKDLMKELDEYFISIKEKPGEYYRSLPLEENGRPEGTCQMRLCQALDAIGKETYYKYYSVIGMNYWGWKVPILDHLLDTIEKNFRAKQEIYDNMDPDERGGQSSIPTEFRLWAEYNHAGYKCDISMFKISTKPSTLNKYMKTYSMMCRKAGFKFPHD